jgi:3-deoxy-manno-octulosonate cytidylyltransferase (CMP-KDO synthetase)
VKSGKVLAVIPARLGSTRFSNKAIYPLKRRPLLYYVHRDVARSRQIDQLVIATDSREIKQVAEAFDAEVVMTSRRHKTGSDRVAEVAAKLGGSIILNIQGDTFGLKPADLDRLVQTVRDNRQIDCATLACRIDSDSELTDPNKVKVAVSVEGKALWFSRYPIPYLQHTPHRGKYRRYPFLRHVGVYCFRGRALTQFAGQRRSACEKAESLEQLRILENGGTIAVLNTRTVPVSVDCPQDLKKLKRLYR